MATAGSSGRRSRVATASIRLLERPHMREIQPRQPQMVVNNPVRLIQAPPPALVAPMDRTIQLLPVHTAAPTAQPAEERPEVLKTPMTIYYGGQVIAFEHFPVERANQLMQMVQSLAGSPAKVLVHEPGKMPEVGEPSAVADPHSIARKASLQRFLEKRKYRISGTDPDDHDEDGSPSKRIDAAAGEAMEDVPDALWLRL